MMNTRYRHRVEAFSACGLHTSTKLLNHYVLAPLNLATEWVLLRVALTSRIKIAGLAVGSARPY